MKVYRIVDGVQTYVSDPVPWWCYVGFGVLIGIAWTVTVLDLVRRR